MNGDRVLVVGAGPAGSSLALRLVRRGVDVTLVDAASFPRSKPCGDCLSPGASPLLAELGLLDRLPARAGELEGWRLRSPGGATAVGRFGSKMGRGSEVGGGGSGSGSGSGDRSDAPVRGLALPRRELDHALVGAAHEAGAELREGTRIFGLLRDEDRVVGVRARDRSGREVTLEAGVVVGADGLRSVVARRLAGVRRGERRRLALVGRFHGVAPDPGGRLGEMRIGRDGCLGLAPLGGGRWNATLVVPLERAPAVAEGRRRFFREGLRRYGVEARFEAAEPLGSLEITGPFEVSPRRTTAPGALLVGDAAGYFDPMTGQGIHRALATAASAADAVIGMLAAVDVSAETSARRRYEDALRRTLGPGRRVQAGLDALAVRPALLDRAVALLSERPRLADLLVDVTGDRLPAAALADPRRLLPALLSRGRPGDSAPLGRPRPSARCRTSSRSRSSTHAPTGAPCRPTTRS